MVLGQAKGVFQTIVKTQLPILLATLIVAAICVFGEPLYDSNDDPGIAMVGAGFGEAAHPDAHLVWCHYGYGLILTILSKLVGPNAHGWVTIAALWLCLALLIRAILHAQQAIVRWSLLLLCLSALFIRALLSAQFTLTAGILFGASIASWLSENSEDGKSFLTYAAIIPALILSYLIRPESYCMGVIIVLPAFVFLSWRRKRWISQYTLMGVFLAAIFFFGSVIDKLAYSCSPDWRFVPEYNNLRAQFNDYGRVPWRPEAPEYKAVGWSSNDYYMFVYWYCRDPIYSLEKLSFLVQKLALPRSVTAVGMVEDWFHYPFTDWPLLLSLAGQIAVFALLTRETRFLGFLFLAGEILAITLAATIGKDAMDSSYVWYTASAVTLMCLIATLVLTRPTQESFLRTAGLVLPGLLGIVALSLVWFGHVNSVREAAGYREWINKNLNQLKGKVVIWAIGLRWEYLITPTRIYPPFPELKVAAIDALNPMPVESDMLKTLGIDNLAEALCTDPAMRLISPGKGLVAVLTRFGEEHYGTAPVFRETAHYENKSAIYALAGVPPQPK